MDDLSFVGTGTSKKDAKRQASEGMIKLLGLDSSSVTKEAPQSCDTVSNTIKRTKFIMQNETDINALHICNSMCLFSD